MCVLLCKWRRVGFAHKDQVYIRPGNRFATGVLIALSRMKCAMQAKILWAKLVHCTKEDAKHWKTLSIALLNNHIKDYLEYLKKKSFFPFFSLKMHIPALLFFFSLSNWKVYWNHKSFRNLFLIVELIHLACMTLGLMAVIFCLRPWSVLLGENRKLSNLVLWKWCGNVTEDLIWSKESQSCLKEKLTIWAFIRKIIVKYDIM